MHQAAAALEPTPEVRHFFRRSRMNSPTSLSLHEQQALADALDDEYKSHETYQQVIRDFGPVRPFINIVQVEARHISALSGLFAKYAVPPPVNRWAGKAPRYASIREACVAGMQGEIDNVAIYDRLLLATHRPDVLQVFHALRSASQDRHQPAFQRSAQRAG
jgi:hypothetical protein